MGSTIPSALSGPGHGTPWGKLTETTLSHALPQRERLLFNRSSVESKLPSFAASLLPPQGDASKMSQIRGSRMGRGSSLSSSLSPGCWRLCSLTILGSNPCSKFMDLAKSLNPRAFHFLSCQMDIMTLSVTSQAAMTVLFTAVSPEPAWLLEMG